MQVDKLHDLIADSLVSKAKLAEAMRVCEEEDEMEERRRWA